MDFGFFFLKTKRTVLKKKKKKEKKKKKRIVFSASFGLFLAIFVFNVNVLFYSREYADFRIDHRRA